MHEQKARSDQENAGCGPRERLWEGTGFPQGRKRGYILSFLHHEVKEISAVIWISENGLEEVGLDY